MTFTSSLPEELLDKLDHWSKTLAIPKNRILESALTIYLDRLNRAEYVKSYAQAKDDRDIIDIAEEGMDDYLTQLD